MQRGACKCGAPERCIPWPAHALVRLTTCAGPRLFSQGRDASSLILGPEESGHMQLCGRLNRQASQQVGRTRPSLCALWWSFWCFPPAYGPVIHLAGLCGRACGRCDSSVVATRPASLHPSVCAGWSCRSLVLGFCWGVDCVRALYRGLLPAGPACLRVLHFSNSDLLVCDYGQGLAGSKPGLARM